MSFLAEKQFSYSQIHLFEDIISIAIKKIFIGPSQELLLMLPLSIIAIMYFLLSYGPSTAVCYRACFHSC